MIGLGAVYAVAGALFAIYALLSLHARRPAHAGFHALIATSFLLGDRLGDAGNGALALAIVVVGGSGLMKRRTDPERPVARPRGNALFVPALIVPATALVGTLAFKAMPAIVDAKQATLIALALGIIAALAGTIVWLRPRVSEPFDEGLRLMDQVGWAALLPQMLASLGAVFAVAGVGEVVGGIAGGAIPNGSLIGAVLAYALGMAGFTIVMGNAFAAFPVMMAAIGMPLLIGVHHGEPAVVAAVGMLAGFCGTLLTPMAANFNLVPAALLGLRDRYAVIRAQAPTAVALLAFNVVLLWWWGFG